MRVNRAGSPTSVTPLSIEAYNWRRPLPKFPLLIMDVINYRLLPFGQTHLADTIERDLGAV